MPATRSTTSSTHSSSPVIPTPPRSDPPPRSPPTPSVRIPPPPLQRTSQSSTIPTVRIPAFTFVPQTHRILKRFQTKEQRRMIHLAVAPYPVLARTVSVVETLGEAQNVIAKTHDICHHTIIQLADSADAVRHSLNDQLQVLEDRDFEVILEHYHEFTRELADSASLS